MLLENSEFLTKAANTFQAAKGDSSVYISQKRLSEREEQPVEPKSTEITDIDPSQKTITGKPTTEEFPVLIRIKTSKSDKFSTVVKQDDLDSFWVQYAATLKNGMTGLKKKEKKKSKKVKK